MVWLELLRRLPLDKIFVAHEPMTHRYARAIDKRGYVIREGVWLGLRQAACSGAVEVAIFAENPLGRRRSGYYCCFRIFHDRELVPVAALLFCFYDGTEKSPMVMGLSAAGALAREGGFK